MTISGRSFEVSNAPESCTCLFSSKNRCRTTTTAILLLLVICFAFHRAFADEDSTRKLNCVDACVLKLVESNGQNISRPALSSVITANRFELNADTRSLDEAITLLRGLGLRCSAISVSPNEDFSFRPKKFVMYAKMGTTAIGHCFFVSDVGGAFEIFDPETGTTYAATIEQVKKFGSVVFICTNQDYFWAKLNAFLWPTFLIGFTICLFFVFHRVLLRIKFLYLKSTKFALVFVIFGFYGCSKTTTIDSDQFVEVGDKVGVGVESVSFCISHRDKKPRKIEGLIASCGCVVVAGDFAGKEVQANSRLVIPATIDLANKHGDFRERIVLKWSDSSVPPLQLEIHGFSRKPCHVEPTFVKLSSDKGQLASVRIELVYLHKIEETPKFVNLQLEHLAIGKGSLEWNVAYELEGLNSSNTPIKKVGIDITFSPGIVILDGEVVVVNGDLQWTDAYANSKIAIHCRINPTVEFVRSEFWLGRVTAESQEFRIPVIWHGPTNFSDIQIAVSDSRLSATWDLEKSEIKLAYLSASDGMPIEAKLVLRENAREIGVATILLN